MAACKPAELNAMARGNRLGDTSAGSSACEAGI